MSIEKAKLKLEGLTKVYENGDGVENINLDVKEGELLTLLGPSGCGKTTILRMLGGFLQQDRGQIVLDGEQVQNLPPEKRPTAMVFQSYNLWPHMTVFDNLAFGLRLRKIDKVEIEKQVKYALDLVRMSAAEKKYPSQLSGGQQQRIAIARALLLKPSVLLLDEPFSALDAKIRGQMREELKKIQNELNITIVFVTHDQEEAMALSDRIVVMNKGVIEQVGSPSEIYDKPASKFVADFIGDMNFIDSSEDELMAIRPENIRLTKTDKSNLCGKINTIMILGHYVEINIETSKGIIKSFIPREEASIYHIGEEVGVEIIKHHKFSKVG